jgi:putative ABC transport system substrate-binding protein
MSEYLNQLIRALQAQVHQERCALDRNRAKGLKESKDEGGQLRRTLQRLEILKGAIPRMTRVAAVFNALNPGTQSLVKETEAAATKLGLKVLPLPIHFPDGVEPAFAEAARLGAGGVVIISDGATIGHRAELGSAALKHRLPTIFANKVYLEGGGLMSYGPDILEVWRRAATYVDKILKGAKPADMPIEQPTTFELVISLKTAKALGLTIPPTLLQRADRVIE